MALHLVRHADAGHGPDEQRSLTARGRRQAAAVAEALVAFPLARILSSRYIRCMETVAPLSATARLATEPVDELAEEADVESAWALVETLTAMGTEAVLCSHGNILSPVLDRLHRRGVDMVADELSFRKGAVWRLESDGDGCIVRAVLAVGRG